MMYEFITANRSWLLERCKQFREARSRAGPDERTDEGIALFLDQLTASLKVDIANGDRSREISGSDVGIPAHFEIGSSAAIQGRHMEELGFNVNDVVHSYGDICHAIVELAMQQAMSFDVGEYRMLNRCLDNAVASAVSEFSYQHDADTAAGRESSENQRLSLIGNELRNQLGTATLAVAALKARELTMGGTTGSILERSLNSLGKLVDEMLRIAEIEEDSSELLGLIPLADFIEEFKATLEETGAAQSRRLNISTVEPRLGVKGSRDTMQAALAGLAQAAFQMTQTNDEIGVHAYASGARIRIDIVCPAASQLPPEQQLALAVVSRMIEGMQGKLTMQDGKDSPLTLTINLPRQTLPN